MHKIFKYRVDPDTGQVIMPADARILRAAHIDDGFYFGDFIWAIVDVAWPCVVLDMTNTIWMEHILDREEQRLTGHKHELGVMEKQEVHLTGIPWGAQEEAGKIYVFHNVEGPIKRYKIAVYKTGQEIDLPVEKLVYLGLNRLWIIQELGLYCFLVND
jgi:hypothetical protein